MGHKRKARGHDTFAEIVEDVTAANPEPDDGQLAPFRSPIAEGEYVDATGTRWHVRGGEPRWARIQHLLRDRAAVVLKVYFDEVTEITAGQRDEFLAVVRPYLKGEHVPTPDDYTDYVAREFKDDQHRSMLIVEEHC